MNFQFLSTDPTDLTDIKPSADWNQSNLNEKMSQKFNRSQSRTSLYQNTF